MGAWELYLLFFLVAFVYASVGFGGGSSYLALLALFGVSYTIARSTSLMCNITVVLGSVVLYHRWGLLAWKRLLPLVALSVPAAFLGGYYPLTERTFYLLLGFALIAAASTTWFSPRLRHMDEEDSSPPGDWSFLEVALGAGIGLLSGMVGIGGGIFLAPALYLLHWGNPRQIAAACSLFILVNSAAGLAGQMLSPIFEFDWQFALPLVGCVLLGGQLGVRVAKGWFPAVYIRKGTALLIFYVAIRLLMK